MSKLHRDILFLIIEELQYSKKSLISCLTVNKIWCEIVVSILWKNPWLHLTYNKEKLFSNTIISHLPDKARNGSSQYFNFFNFLKTPNDTSKRPLFNYISYCKHLNLEEIERIFHTHNQYKDILKLFINKDAEYTHLYLPNYHDYHLIPGIEKCFSKIKFLCCDCRVNDNNLVILTKMCKSIKELELHIYKDNNNYGISKLIENQKNLISIDLSDKEDDPYDFYDRTFCKILGDSLVKHSNTLQYFKILLYRPKSELQIFASFVNLKNLKLMGGQSRWKYRENISLPSLEILHSIYDINIEGLPNFIRNSGGKLSEITISYLVCFPAYANSIKELIQAIYQNCPNLTYLCIPYKNDNILDLEILLNKCKYLKVLGIYYGARNQLSDWDNLFNILTTSSPPSLFNFKFIFPVNMPDSESLKLFFDNWEGRRPMIFDINVEDYFFQNSELTQEEQLEPLEDLVERYKEKGVLVKNFDPFSFGFH